MVEGFSNLIRLSHFLNKSISPDQIFVSYASNWCTISREKTYWECNGIKIKEIYWNIQIKFKIFEWFSKDIRKQNIFRKSSSRENRII